MAGSSLLQKLGSTESGNKDGEVQEAMGEGRQRVNGAAITPRFGSNSKPADQAKSVLYLVLAKERISISQTTKLPPYMISTEQTLLHMAQARPTSR